MRQLGETAGQRRAERLINFLAAQKIQAESREGNDDRFVIWVINEDDMPAAEEHYRAFKIAPDAAVFDAPPAPQKKPPPAARPAGGRSRYIDVRREIFGMPTHKRMPMVVGLIVASGVGTMISLLPGLSGLREWLNYSNYFGTNFPEIAHGQLWRLVTPIFMHGGILHLLFNMMWLYQLGGAIEAEEGPLTLGAMTFTIAAVVDTAQYLVSGPLFLGMSGVVYALFGYIWMMSRYQMGSRYFLPSQTVIIMIGWLVVCLLGILPGVANTEHVGGLVCGMLWGIVRSGAIKTWLRQQRR